jgi:hypothetical protein
MAITNKFEKIMAKQIVFIASLLLTCSVYGQNAEEQNHNCIKKNFTSFTARLKKYPFNLTAEIQFVSFKGGVYLIDNEIVREDSLPRINDSILYSKLIEVKTLTFPQIDKLTDIFYNYGFRGPIHTMSETECYNPRNAILFLDKNNKVIEFIEICFECRKTSESTDKISMGEMCKQKLNMLFDLFKIVGIEYGITKGVVPGD